MPATDVYIDTGRGKIVRSPQDATIVSFPPLTRGTTINLNLWFLKPTGNAVGTNLFTLIPVDGQTVELAIGLLGAASTLTQQFTWTPNTDPAQPYFSAALSLNTDNITAALGSSDSIQPWLQIIRVDSGTPVPTIFQQVTLTNAIIVPGVTDAIIGMTPVYIETLIPMLKNLIVNSITFQNATDPTKQIRVYSGPETPTSLHEDTL